MVSTIAELNDRWVDPHYLLLLHGNFLRLEGPQLASFLTSLRRDLAEVDEQTVGRLLRLTWREQLTGSWFSGLNRWAQFLPLIGDKLLQNSGGYEGYCFALARFADEESVEYLRLYLDEYLPRVRDQYGQHWALGALLWLDGARGTDYGQSYLEPGGLWERYIADKRQHGRWEAVDVAANFRGIMEFCKKQIDTETGPTTI